MNSTLWREIAACWCVITSAEEHERVKAFVDRLYEKAQKTRTTRVSLAEEIMMGALEEDDDDGY